MNLWIAFAVFAIAEFGFSIWFGAWAAHQPTDLELAVERLNAATRDLNKAFAEALRPALVRATQSMNRFVEQMKKDPS